MDPLSDILSLLRPHDCVAAGLVAGGTWSIYFEAHEGLKCNGIVEGSCSLSVNDGPTVALTAGDCVILPHGLPFVVWSGAATRPADARSIYAPSRHGGTARYGKGEDFYMTGARFLLAGPNARMLLGTLPPVLVLRHGADDGIVPWFLSRLAAELRNPQIGGALTITHLSHVLLVHVIRSALAQGDIEQTGWLSSLTNPKIMPAIAAIHADPARAWTVEDLAAVAAQSRTTFAVRFRAVVGQSPIEYLTKWRMLLAVERLRVPGSSVATVATEVGYGSESAFAAAFRRTMGAAPRTYLRQIEIEPLEENSHRTQLEV
ncbi:transcriptional regulator, AraC family protein [Stappia aggregata IAM 12614]|uniref:Transcriptional regulator, AraC family protein n=1 Tax=Roseibium aggregatum (strain ATCC 25650 / DSM 13394 / JCM 20685 / NBRC 16684 / NCIMB 2208 / IAM 12614 / B1) TaxID=384765 RepID=A0P1X0_ROSAI|nr:AraC family transcriptional regulator [Roseibium aggregatum]EAV41046.1 transcriptional regulator, AraC family protein [Stappia aggregata IAM 12614] [Roseibium aggregatum IAM 12614]